MSRIIKLFLISIIATQQIIIAKPHHKKPKKPRSFGHSSSQSTTITARVRQGNDICTQEIAALKNRAEISHQALETFMGTAIDQACMPTLGMVCSGGGVRAAIATLGLMRGLETIGLLDAVQYATGLSGSTWGLSSWLSHTMTLDEFTAFFKKRLDGALTFKNMNEAAILKAIFNKAKTTLDVGFNDVWGTILADLFLMEKNTTGQNRFFSDFAAKARSGKYPFPIFTSIIGETNADYQWVEYSPFEVGSTYLKTWIPTTAFGKSFDKGTSFDTRSEEPLGFLLGLFGSSYAISASDAFRLINDKLMKTYNIGFSDALITALSTGDNNRLVYASANNFAFNLKKTPLANEKKLTLIDAGFSFNFPFPPLIRRNVNVYIVCDATSSSNSAQGNDMHLVEAYARKNKIALPRIDYSILAKEPISVWGDDNPQTPIIIFIRNVHDFSSFKFNYTSTEFDLVLKSIEQTVVANAAAIKQALQKAIAKRS